MCVCPFRLKEQLISDLVLAGKTHENLNKKYEERIVSLEQVTCNVCFVYIVYVQYSTVQYSACTHIVVHKGERAARAQSAPRCGCASRNRIAQLESMLERQRQTQSEPAAVSRRPTTTELNAVSKNTALTAELSDLRTTYEYSTALYTVLNYESTICGLVHWACGVGQGPLPKLLE